MKIVKWKRIETGKTRDMMVLWEKYNPTRWLSVGGGIYDLHFQLGRLVITWESKEEYDFTNGSREASASRHPAS